MRLSLLIFFLLISIISMGQVNPAATINERQEDSLINALQKQTIGKPFPIFVAVSENGVITNDSLKGKVTYVNLWEASCAPCMAEMNVLSRLYDTLEDNPNFEFISLSSDNMETIRKIKETYHIPYQMGHVSEEECYQMNKGAGFPTSIILDSKGIVKYIHAGGYIESDKINRFIFTTDVYPAIMKQLYLIQFGR